MTKKKKWNKKDIPDLTGKIILVTGANSGTGFEFSKIVASHNGHVILACRNLEKGEIAKKKIIKQIPNASLDLIKLDLSDLSSVREFSDIVKQKYEQIDILCNNAGIMLTPQIKTVDGFDIQFGTNHLGHYALTGLLFEILAPDARIVNMSSSAHNYGDIHFDDINLEKSFGSLKAYGQSKLANMLFTYELDRKIKGKKLSIITTGTHPGWAATNLQSTGINMGKGISRPIKRISFKIGSILLAQSAEKGSHPMLMAATSNEIQGGEYIGPARFGGMRGYPKIVKSSKKSYDEEKASKLWDLSEELTGIKFDI